MEPKAKRRKAGEGEVKPPAPSDPDGMFRGIIAFLVPEGVQLRRLQIWKQKLLQMGGMIENNFSERVSHVLALDSEKALEKLGLEQLKEFIGEIIQYDWLEACLKSGNRLSTELYILDIKSELAHNHSTERSSSNDLKVSDPSSEIEQRNHYTDSSVILSRGESQSSPVHTDSNSDGESPRRIVSDASMEEPSLLYNPPDLNRDICEIFGKLINIYRALGDDRRSFSYYKAIPVIEKLPFKIESVDQVKHLPAIGKSMQDHVGGEY